METHSQEQLDSNLNQCQLRLRYFFHNVSLLRTALTHSSGANTPLMSNERMEFLGDAILGYTICEKLFAQFPDLQEGELTKIKSEVVSRATCNELGKGLGLDEFLILGRGLTPKRLPNSILANTMEAIIAAIYLDGGMTVVQKFILEVFGPVINKVSQNTDGNNFKSVLQQIAQRELHASPEYTVITTSGPDHGRCFKVAVRIKQHNFLPAWGNTKKEAEQRAAENALAMLAGNTPPYGE
jgi:ribonuclease-3